MDWASYRAHREHIKAERGQFVGLLDKNWEPVMDVEDWEEAEWPALYGEPGSMSMTIPGEITPGVRNPVIDYLLGSTLTQLDDVASLDALFHSAEHIIVERPGLARRCYRITSIIAEGGRDNPRSVRVKGVDMLEHLKHLPLWADPSNRSKIAQLQFSDIQGGAAEHVCRKLLIRNLHGYQQPSLLSAGLLPGAMAWTEDYYEPSKWSDFQPDMHSVVCSPVLSGIPTENTVIEARWDNAWDLLKPTLDAAGIMPTAVLWLPGDPQPFPNHATLRLPTVVLDFKPRAAVPGFRTIIGQKLGQIMRMIDSDDHVTSVLQFSEQEVPTSDGRKPWVVFDFDEAPEVEVTKSTDGRFLVGGKSPKLVNDVMEVGIKTAFAAAIAAIPVLGAPIAEAIKGGGELLAKMSADRFLNLNEFQDKNRRYHYGRSGFISLSKPGQSNSRETLQKFWQAKSETEGGLSFEFTVDDPYPYAPGRDFDLGDTVGITAWNAVWGAYLSGLTWTSKPGEPLGWKFAVGNLAHLKNRDALAEQGWESVMTVLARGVTEVTG